MARRAAAALRFVKAEGAGNDFVILDARSGDRPRLSRSGIRRLLDRNRGIGGDGLLLLRPGIVGGRARVLYWNPDGGPADFCGNGARCAALLLLREARRNEIVFDFGRRRLKARRKPGGRIALLVPAPRPLPLPKGVPAELRAGSGSAWIDAGVPHWILPVESVDEIDLGEVAPPIRRWEALGSDGTNVDAVEVRDSEVRVRTWERGVEGETLACGSGLLAAGYWAATVRGVRLPLRLRSRGGDWFRLSADPEGLGYWLEGPARIVFSGKIEAS
jgi:diaminopimelate epimerase